MARITSSVGNSMTYGTHPGVDDYATKTVGLYVRDLTVAAGGDVRIVGKATGVAAWGFSLARAAALETEAHLHFQHDFATTDGDWASASGSVTISGTPMQSLCATYNRGATANDPVGYVNGTSTAMPSVLVDPVGAVGSDGAQTLNTASTTTFYTVGWFIYDDTILTAADMNRHRWWGVAPGGPSTINVWHPMWTDDLSNKGTAPVADLTTDTTATDMARVERMHGSFMGCGR